MSQNKVKGLKRNRIVEVVCLVSIVCAGLFVFPLLGSASTANPPWILNAPPVSGYDWVVGHYANGTAYAERGDWQFWVNGADYAMINYALNALVGTYPQSVLVTGNFSLSQSPTIYKNYTSLHVDGKWTLANNANVPILRLDPTEPVLLGVTVDLVDAEFDGNMAQQSSNAACGINFTRTSGALPAGVTRVPSILVKGGYVHNCYSQGVWCNFYGSDDGGEIRFEGTTSQYNGCTDTTGYGGANVVWKGVFDSQWIGGLIGEDDQFAFLGVVVSGSILKFDYVNGHSKLMTCDRLGVSLGYSDCSTNHDSLSLYSVNASRFYNTVFNKMAGTNNTYSGIHVDTLVAGSTGNSFVDLVGTRYTAASMFSYVVEEVDNAQVGNSYAGINGYFCGKALRVLGAGGNYSAVVGAVAVS